VGEEGARIEALWEGENLMLTKREGAEKVVLWRVVICEARASRWVWVRVVWWIIS